MIIKEYDFDDAVVLPVNSQNNSRENTDISVKLSDNLTIAFPLIASPMRGIVDAQFINRLSELGGLGILHRFFDNDKEHHREIKDVSTAKLFGIALGLVDSNQSYISIMSYNPRVVVIDVANGYASNLLKKCADVKKIIQEYSPNTLLMSGNVATKQGAQSLKDAGVDIIRVGIGNGAECSTTNVTGIGRPILSAIMDCAEVEDVIICADGGLKNSGDFVKAIVAGADICMAGALFAQVFESTNDGIIYGQASKKLQEMRGTQIKSIEGFERIVRKTMNLEAFVKEFSYGIKSAGTYLNADTLVDMCANGRFVEAGRSTIKKEY